MSVAFDAQGDTVTDARRHHDQHASGLALVGTRRSQQGLPLFQVGRPRAARACRPDGRSGPRCRRSLSPTLAGGAGVAGRGSCQRASPPSIGVMYWVTWWPGMGERPGILPPSQQRPQFERGLAQQGQQLALDRAPGHAGRSQHRVERAHRPALHVCAVEPLPHGRRARAPRSRCRSPAAAPDPVRRARQRLR